MTTTQPANGDKTMKFELTETHRRRINQGIAEAKRVIAKAECYKEEFRDHGLIQKNRDYIEKMEKALEEGVLVAG